MFVSEFHLKVFWILSKENFYQIRATQTKTSEIPFPSSPGWFFLAKIGCETSAIVAILVEISLGQASHGFLGLIIQPTICFGHFFFAEINASRFHIPNDNLESSLVTKAFEHHGLPMGLGPCWPGRKRRNVLLRRNAHKLWFFWYEIVSNLIAVLEKAARIWFLYRNAIISR